MGIVYTPDSDYAKELAKYEQWSTLLAPVPGRPYQYRPFPQMLYRARQLPNGQAGCFLPTASIADEAAEAFARSCQLIVHDADQARRAYLEGWRASVAEAVEAYEQRQQAIADAAAETAHAAQRMSARAQYELQQADQATHQHVTDVPRPPRRKPGRKPKATTVLHVQGSAHGDEKER